MKAEGRVARKDDGFKEVQEPKGELARCLEAQQLRDHEALLQQEAKAVQSAQQVVQALPQDQKLSSVAELELEKWGELYEQVRDFESACTLLRLFAADPKLMKGHTALYLQAQMTVDKGVALAHRQAMRRDSMMGWVNMPKRAIRASLGVLLRCIPFQLLRRKALQLETVQPADVEAVIQQREEPSLADGPAEVDRTASKPAVVVAVPGQPAARAGKQQAGVTPGQVDADFSDDPDLSSVRHGKRTRTLRRQQQRLEREALRG